MERIIIREVDNTSNVEALSSYDVAYVPGFALGTNGVNESLYRVPTLCRDKYEFVKRYGSACPTFEAAQPYPAGFPEKAIKWGDAQTSYYKVQVNNFTEVDDIQDSGYYTRLYGVPTEDNIPGVVQYYLAERILNSGTYNLTPIGNTVGDAYIHSESGDPYNMTTVFGKSYYTATFTQVAEAASVINPLDTFNGRYEEASISDFSNKDNESYYTATVVEGETVYEEVDTSTEPYDSSETYFVFTFGPNISYYLKTNNPVTYTFAVNYKSGKTYYTSDDLTAASITVFADGVTYYEYIPFTQKFVKVDTETETKPILPDSTKFIFSSTVVPKNVWYTSYTEEGDTPATDDYIIPSTESYYGKMDSGVQPMFNAGDADPGYRYALTLLSLGVPVYFEQMNVSTNDINVPKMYAGLHNRFSPTEPTDTTDYSFDSIGDYNVKFLTSGGYPTFEYDSNSLAGDMYVMAAKRADSIALIDHTDNPSRPLTVYDEDSIINSARAWGGQVNENGTFAAMFTPWYECSHSAVTSMEDTEGNLTKFNNRMMPGSLAYLTALAVQLQNYNPWLAVSGVTRGLVPFCVDLHTDKPLTNNIADSYQALPGDTGVTTSVSINPITYIRNYGYCIWGNRTLRNNENGTKASSFLNIRSAVSDIKKRLYEASQQILFEQNTDVTWLNFKSLILPLLETMVSDYILEDYAVTRLYTDPNTGYPVPAYEIMAIIRIQPINSVEVFDLTIYMENTEEFSITTTESE